AADIFVSLPHCTTCPETSVCDLSFMSSRLPLLIALLPALAPLSLTSSAFAQTLAAAPASAAVSGRIQNSVTGQYLTNARIAVRGTDRVVFTDDSGIFRLTGLTPGAVVLDVFFTGLDPQQIPLELAAGENLT